MDLRDVLYVLGRMYELVLSIYLVGRTSFEGRINEGLQCSNLIFLFSYTILWECGKSKLTSVVDNPKVTRPQVTRPQARNYDIATTNISLVIKKKKKKTLTKSPTCRKLYNKYIGILR